MVSIAARPTSVRYDRFRDEPRFRLDDFFVERFRDDDFFAEERFRDDDFFRDDLRGTFAPFFRASDNPIAIACLRLFTVPPCPFFPRLSVPFFRRCIARFTLLLAPRPYLRPPDFLAAISLASV